jgi:hypothetical protein
MATAQIQHRRFLSHRRYEKGNLTSTKRPLTFAALRSKNMRYFQSVAQISVSDGFHAGELRSRAHMIAALRP